MAPEEIAENHNRAEKFCIFDTICWSWLVTRDQPTMAGANESDVLEFPQYLYLKILTWRFQ